ncbi:LmeA family phospholipid-binding protein [Pseudonocardia sp. NPDC046786]|uniref:LmeA family phospholipid-binding protein n=1 Tax=Pseudonocardia sp. NPDC046786 TaxID=3155471 RepID=UPI0033D3D824
MALAETAGTGAGYAGTRSGTSGHEAPGTWETAALLASGTGPGTALLLRALVEAVRYRYVGRETTLRSGEVDVRLVPTSVSTSGLDPRALSTGRLDEVRLTARDVVRPALRLRELTVVASDVRLRPALTPGLRTGPVAFTAVLDPAWIAGRLRERAPGLAVTIDPDGVVRARRRGRPGFGSADLDLSLDGHTLAWTVTALTVAGRRMGPPRSAEARRSVRALLDRSPLRGVRSGTVTLPGLPAGLRLHRLDTAPGRVAVHGTLDGWQREIPVAGLDGVLRGALSLLDLGR